MSKYSNEFKLKIVKYCVEGHHSREGTVKEFGMPRKRLKTGEIYDIILCIQNSSTVKGYRIIIFHSL